VVALAPAVAQGDVLGAFDACELYLALVRDAPTRELALDLVCVAGHDPRLTSRELVDLADVLELNHPP
jgi:hypothetical protein